MSLVFTSSHLAESSHCIFPMSLVSWEKKETGMGFTAGTGLQPAWSSAGQGGPGLVMVCWFKECLACLVAWVLSCRVS